MTASNDACRTTSKRTAFMYMGDTPVVYHCHHFNLFLDQTIDDALGPERGERLRFEAARAASRELLADVIACLEAETTTEQMAAAVDLFARMGHGRLSVLADATGNGSATGASLHYGYAWREKYARITSRKRPIDFFAAGYAAAATETVYGLPAESIDATETACIALKDPECRFQLQPGKATPSRPRIDRKAAEAAAHAPIDSIEEDRISKIASGLREFTAKVEGAEHGLIQAFGVFVTMHLAGYYNRISFDTWHTLRDQAPDFVALAEELFRESGHVCVFNTFGGILQSPEWEALVGVPSADPLELISSLVAIGRSLGFGRWAIHEFEPGERLVLQTPSSYESAYYLTQHGQSDRPNEFFLQGAALAMMVLVHRIDWNSPPVLTQDLYNDLFRKGLGWQVEQTSSLSCGAPYSEVVVTRSIGQ